MHQNRRRPSITSVKNKNQEYESNNMDSLIIKEQFIPNNEKPITTIIQEAFPLKNDLELQQIQSTEIDSSNSMLFKTQNFKHIKNNIHKNSSNESFYSIDML